MSSYVVLARKWRPAQFSDIVGQGHIVRTLMNAVRSERIHQAYLFTGSRGIGKTSIARIFAKVLRCPNGTDVAGPDGQKWLHSCGACPSCIEIAAGTGMDVLEIDGASNNGVDAVREIRENAKYVPASGGRKIYVIDEVHMLTTAAFNALLKTLEEPPPHVVFIFATTEAHKIPPTILSRCQRFDYRRVTVAQIQTRLAEIVAAEGLSADAAALALIARAAEGSMRDSLSLLDQVIAFAGQHVTVESVRESVGLMEGQALLGILRAVLARKPLDALEAVESAYAQGHDLRGLTKSLIELLHAAILARVGAQPQGSELSEDELRELAEIATLRSLEEIELIFQVLHYGLESIARSTQPKVILDVLLVKCATAEALIKVSDTRVESIAQAESANAPQFAQRPVTRSTPAAQVSPTPAPVIQMASAPIQIPTAPIAATPSATQVSPPLSWEGWITHVREKRPLLASILEHGMCDAIPTTVNPVLTVFFSEEKTAFYKEQLQTRVYVDQLGALAREYFGLSVLRVQLETRNGGESVAARRERESREREESARESAANHPILKEARALFGVEPGPIEVHHA